MASRDQPLIHLSYIEYEATLPDWLREVHEQARQYAIEHHGIVNVEGYPRRSYATEEIPHEVLGIDSVQRPERRL